MSSSLYYFDFVEMKVVRLRTLTPLSPFWSRDFSTVEMKVVRLRTLTPGWMSLILPFLFRRNEGRPFKDIDTIKLISA